MKCTEDNRPWHHLPDAHEPLVEAMFRASTFFELGDGHNALFWDDRWLHGKSLPDVASSLCAAVGPRIRKSRTVAQALQGDSWINDISGALMVQVIMDYLLIWNMTRQVQLVSGRADRLCWKWTADKKFSTSSAYQSFFIGQHPVQGAGLLRKTRAPAKCKFFFWLVIHDRCWTATRRKKHGLQDDDLCAFCAQAPESIDHLLIQCPFSREVWFNLFCRIGWHSVSPTNQNSWVVDWWTLARKSIHKDERQCFDSMVTLMCWMLWKERNGRIFDQRFRTVADVLVGVIDEIVAWSRAG